MPLYDIVIASKDAGLAIVRSRDPLRSYYGFSCRPIDHTKLGTLMELLDLGTFEANLKMLDPSFMAGSDGPWATELPAILLDQIQGLTSTEIEKIALRWADTEEFKLDRIGVQEAKDFLNQLTKLWRERHSDNERVFLWSSL